jgi:hypothetical protein
MTDDINRAADAVEALDFNASVANASALADAFETAGDRIAVSLETAARRGSLSFNDMAETILRDLARVAVTELVEAPLQGLINGLSGSFQNAVSGGRTNVVMNITGATDADSFRRSEGQIAAGLARATQAGARRIG